MNKRRSIDASSIAHCDEGPGGGEARSLRDLSPEDRPREKLTRAGVGALGDDELLALVIGHGTAGRSALGVAAALLRDAGGLHGLSRAGRRRLTRVRGIGQTKASRVLAAIELGRRTLFTQPDRRDPIITPADASKVLVPRYGAFPVERFGALMLDARGRLIGIHLVSSGVLDAAVAIPRDVFREAAIAGAAAVILFHNHPSGDPRPSADDVALTRRMVDAGRIVGIDVVDHLILADASYCSMKTAKCM